MTERSGLFNPDSVADKGLEAQYIEQLHALRTKMDATKDQTQAKAIVEQIRSIEKARRELGGGEAQKAA